VKLRTLVNLCLYGALIGVLALAGLGAWVWRSVSTDIAEIRQLAELRRANEQLRIAIDYATLQRRDAAITAAIRRDALALQQGFRAVGHPSAAAAINHLAEIVHLSNLLPVEEPQASESAPSGEGEIPLPLTRQLQIHEAGLAEVLGAILDDRNNALARALLVSLMVLALATALFVALCAVAFGLVQRRIGAPLQTLEAGLHSFASGDLDTRIPLAGRDEFSELAASFNRMAELRHLAESSLRESDERFRLLVDRIAEVFWISDAERLRMLYISPAFEGIWGRPRDGFLADAQKLYDVIYPGDRERVRKTLESLDGESYAVEFRIVRPDGQLRWILDCGYPVEDGSGRVVRHVGVSQDITERKLAELQLAERVKELRCLYQVLELTTSAELSQVEVLAQVARLLPASLQQPETAVARVEVEGEVYTSDTWTEPACALRGAIVADGRQLGSVTLGYLLADSAEEEAFIPEERVLLDGVCIHLGRMLHSRRMAEMLSQAERLKVVGELTGGVAHDFNNLLTVILGNADLLSEALAQAPELKSLADMVGAAAQRGAELTQRLLAFSRRQALAPEAVDANQLLAGIEGLLRRALGEQVDIEVVRAAGLWPALVDPGQLENAILNLALNARDAMVGGGRLTIETANVCLDLDYTRLQGDVAPGDYVLVAVSDTGTGIPPEVLAKVFEPFYTTKDKSKGTGLGLSMVYGFVKQSEGHIKLYSEPGEGTTVKMYLPRSGSVAGRELPEKSAEPPEGGRQTILLVEDDPLVQDFAAAQLAELGYRVLVAGDGPEALEILGRDIDIDLLFTDVVMPGGLNGRQLAEAAQDLRPGLKVLYTSGYTDNAIVHHGRLDADALMLGKPYRRAELAAKIAVALGEGETRR